MRRIIPILALTVLILGAGGCIKETYDMTMLSKKAHISPVLGISAVRGDISLRDIVEPDGALVLDDNNPVKFVFTMDSVINLRLEDFYDFEEILSYNGVYTVGEITLSPFRSTLTYSLDRISTYFSPALRTEFLALDGTAGPFPAFPLTDPGEAVFPDISGFEYAHLTGGFIDVSVTNNLAAPTGSISVQLYNSSDHTPVGGEAAIPPLSPGETGIASIDLSGLTVRNSIAAAVVLAGSPGTSGPVPIDLSGSNIMVGIEGRSLTVRSGRVIVPEQTISSVEKRDTATVNPGSDTEIVRFKLKSGDINYMVQTHCPLRTRVRLVLPTARKAGTPMTREIFVHANSTATGKIGADNFEIDLSTDPRQPYNRIPVEHTINVTSYGYMVNFSSTDTYNVGVELINPYFDYIEGYFGQQTQTGDTDTLDPGLKDLLKKFSGDIFLSNPSLRLRYSNSFGIPVLVSVDLEGRRGSDIVHLGLAPFSIDHPVDKVTRDITSSYTINRTNSTLPRLISMPPEEIRFTGSAKLNPGGKAGSVNNFVFDGSRILGSLEIEIPLEMRINNLQFADTTGNFLRRGDPEDDPVFSAGDFESARIDLTAKNGFPLGISVSMHLYNSASETILGSVEAKDMLRAAPVDAGGRVTGPGESVTRIEFTRDFLSSAEDADRIIFRFTANSTDNRTRDVKIYADYRIDFRAVLVMKPDIKFNFR